MKKGFVMFIFVMLAFSSLSLVSAACDLSAELVNQDPYPAIPGDSVEVVFQLSGVSNPECKGAVFDLVLSYPFSLEKDETSLRTLPGSTYSSGYKREWVIPYDLIIDENTLDGKKEIEVKYKSGIGELYRSEKFNISVEDVRTDFEVSIKDYDSVNNEITFEILNIGEQDIEALTIDVPEQENLTLKGTPRVIVGSLDSNEEDTFRIKAKPVKGILNLEITYTDKINERRTLEKSVFFEPSYFKIEEEWSMGAWGYILILAIAVGVFFWIRKRRKEKRRKNQEKKR